MHPVAEDSPFVIKRSDQTRPAIPVTEPDSSLTCIIKHYIPCFGYLIQLLLVMVCALFYVKDATARFLTLRHRLCFSSVVSSFCLPDPCLSAIGSTTTWPPFSALLSVTVFAPTRSLVAQGWSGRYPALSLAWFARVRTQCMLAPLM